MRIMVAGALGEVGRTLSAALRNLGHDVAPVSSRAPLGDGQDVLSLPEAVRALQGVDAVINCSGRGDRRASERAGTDASSVLAPACRSRGVPAVLISTTRVLEGYDEDYPGDAAPRARTPYALANAANEAVWLDAGGSAVLRLSNYFAPPMTPTSPQAQLLPWSLVTEGLESGAIGIRSGPATAREFVSARDVATAALTVLTAPGRPPVCATVPGAVMTLRTLATASQDAMAAIGLPVPPVTFGPDTAPGPQCLPGWLLEEGWSGTLTPSEVRKEITSWLLRQGVPASRGA